MISSFLFRWQTLSESCALSLKQGVSRMRLPCVQAPGTKRLNTCRCDHHLQATIFWPHPYEPPGTVCAWARTHTTPFINVRSVTKRPLHFEMSHGKESSFRFLFCTEWFLRAFKMPFLQWSCQSCSLNCAFLATLFLISCCFFKDERPFASWRAKWT